MNPSRFRSHRSLRSSRIHGFTRRLLILSLLSLPLTACGADDPDEPAGDTDGTPDTNDADAADAQEPDTEDTDAEPTDADTEDNDTDPEETREIIGCIGTGSCSGQPVCPTNLGCQANTTITNCSQQYYCPNPVSNQCPNPFCSYDNLSGCTYAPGWEAKLTGCNTYTTYEDCQSNSCFVIGAQTLCSGTWSCEHIDVSDVAPDRREELCTRASGYGAYGVYCQPVYAD